jgi:mannitol/fructose-specific phosphotransferase system IIA component
MAPAWLDPEAARSALGFPLVALPPTVTESAEAAIRFLVVQAQVAGAVPAAVAEAALRSALRREQLASTAVGGGLALPHAASWELPEQAGVLGSAGPGVNWATPDGQPVRLVCLMLLRCRGAGKLRFVESVGAYFRRRGHPWFRAGELDGFHADEALTCNQMASMTGIIVRSGHAESTRGDHR